MTRTVLLAGGGFLAGVAVAFALRRTTEGKCCAMVRDGVRDRLREACGPLGGLCVGAAGGLGLIDHAPDLLDWLS